MASIRDGIRDDVNAKGGGFGRFEVITGERRRRAWSVEEKLAIVAESFSAATSISEVARRHQLNGNQLFQWRAPFRRGELGGATVGSFVPLVVAAAIAPVGVPAPQPGSMLPVAPIEILLGAATIRVAPGADEATLRLVLAAMAGLS